MTVVTRSPRWALLSGLALMIGVAAAVLVLHDTARHWVGWNLTSHVGAPESTSAVSPLPRPGPDLRLAVAGDVGTGDAAEWTTAGVVDDLEDDREFDALVLLGDNIYPSGDSTQVDRMVFDPFAGVLDHDTALLAVLGNHDVEDGSGDAVVDALGMPGRWWSQRLGDVLLVGLDSTRTEDPDQLAWLERTLAENTATWVIVALHHPPYSAGFHGSDQLVRDTFVPLFERFGVDLVLAGHDHDYQRSNPIHGVTYVVSGAAAKLRGSGRAEFTAFAASTHSFVDLAVWADHIQLHAIDADGRLFDELVLAR